MNMASFILKKPWGSNNMKNTVHQDDYVACGKENS